jgi:prephenate dehydrogenase
MIGGIGVIGFGRFGRFMVEQLVGDFSVLVYASSANKKDQIMASGALAEDLETVCAQDIVIVCVPISVLEECFGKIAPLLKPGSLVMDVASVKVFPVSWMKAKLPREVEILPTHPMFGPDSAAESLVGHKIVLCRERISDERYASVKVWLNSKKLEVIEISAKAHDQCIAATLTLTHFVGRSLFAYGATDSHIDTLGYRRLLDVVNEVGNDTWQLFEDMNRYNPYAAQERRKLLHAAGTVDQKLQKLESLKNLDKD